ncbi:MAG TPA: S8 family serine peptidase [Terriglobales bacterium]|nr:S8 family serine peptidase [Terriglobales bacterium]
MSESRIFFSTNFSKARCSMGAVTILLIFFVLTASSLSGQSPKTTDVQLHKFQPTVQPGQAAPGVSKAETSNQETSSNGISATAVQQILALQQEKASRTAPQQKVDSNILFTIRMMAGQPVAPGVPSLYTGVDLDADNRIVVDIVANVTDALLAQLTAANAQVLYTNQALRSIRASIPPQQIEAIAASPDVIFISPKQGSLTRQQDGTGRSRPGFQRNTVPGFKQRAAQVRRQLAAGLNSMGTVQMGQGSVETEGDLTHRTLDARGVFGVNGSPLKIGVLSDGVTSLARSQATGDLPPTCGTPPCLTVLTGQAGAGDEGTAMMEIIHDMAPGASLYFATADNSITSFAQNIRNLRTAGCDIIVDDVFYFVESPFQDGETPAVVSTSQGGVVTQAVNDVVASGALYFSAAGNEGNEDGSTSGTYEGDFNPTAAGAPLPTGNVNNFGSTNYDTITSPGEQVVGLWWSDPLGGSGNDYDLYLLNSTGTSVLGASTNIQNGTQDPVELIGSANVINNNRLVVFQHTGAANRFFHLVLFRGRLSVNTAGETHGHSAASGAFTVAATPAATSAGAPTPNGPFPNPFTSANQIEFFSSDGLRHIFFNGDSTAITAGNFSSTGGQVLNKPDITAADGVSVTGVGGFGSPFYGTSAAAPAAAAVAALVLAADPTLTPAQVRTTLTSTAVDIMGSGFDRDSGSGIVMAWEAINSLGVPAYANPELASVTANENPGNANGAIEAGEGAILILPLTNLSGVKAATGVTAILSTTTPKVYITLPGTSAYADMAAGSSGGNNLSPFTFTLESDFPCGQTVDFTLTVNYTGGPQRAINFTVPTGYFFIANTLGTTPPALPGITTATGAQVNRINRNGVISACGTPKAFPGTITGSHTFDSYTFTACQAFCMQPELSSGTSGINLFEAAYTPSYTPSSIGTNYAGDAGLSTNTQSFGITTTTATPYTIVVSDVAGNSPPNSYTIKIPACALDCTVNQLPVAVAQDVTVTAAHFGGTAAANVNNGSYDPDGDAITLTQAPVGPYGIGITNVMLTVVDTQGATAQITANVTVNNPPNQTPVAIAHNVTVIAANTGGTAAADIDNGSHDLDGDSVTLTQAPPGPYAIGKTSVKLTAQDSRGATAQATATVTVLNPGFGFAATLPSVSTTAGHPATEHITFTPNPGIAAAMTLACSGLPTGAACSFLPSTIPAGSVEKDIVLTVNTTASSAAMSQWGNLEAAWLPMTGLGLVGIAVIAVPRKRRRASVLLLALLLGSLVWVVSCGIDRRPPVAKSKTSTVTVTGTSGNMKQSTTFSLTIN